MSGTAFLFILAVVLVAVLLFGMVFFIIMLSDLECDYINPIDCCNKLNQFVIPEYALHGFLTVIFLPAGQFIAFLMNLPLVGYHAWKYTQKKHTYDATSIFQQLKYHRQECLVKLGFYLLCFFFYLYRMMVALLD
eukprot:Clim_evm3s219 gene=Clim_evmTU3s219